MKSNTPAAPSARARESGRHPDSRLAASVALLLCLLPVVTCRAAEATPAVPAVPAVPAAELEAKANFLYNAAKFVDWPGSRFVGTTSPIVIGILARNAVTDQLEKNLKDTLKGQQINSRDVVVRLVNSLAEIRAVHILFVGAGDDVRFAGLSPVLKGSTILTIGESAAFARAGGVIMFKVAAGKVQFEIDLDAADLAGLRISSQLMRLAAAVHKKN